MSDDAVFHCKTHGDYATHFDRCPACIEATRAPLRDCALVKEIRQRIGLMLYAARGDLYDALGRLGAKDAGTLTDQEDRDCDQMAAMADRIDRTIAEFHRQA